jgi:hypothetical protein
MAFAHKQVGDSGLFALDESVQRFKFDMFGASKATKLFIAKNRSLLTLTGDTTTTIQTLTLLLRANKRSGSKEVWELSAFCARKGEECIVPWALLPRCF